MWPLATRIHLTLASLAFAPVYLVCACMLMLYSALATKAPGWRTPANVALPLRHFSWPVLN